MCSDCTGIECNCNCKNEPPDNRNCPAYWDYKGVKFPCDLEKTHFGPHVNYPKEKGTDAVIIWSSCNDEVE